MVPLLRLTSKSFKNEFRVTYGLNYNLEIDLWCTTRDEVIGNRINLTAKLLILYPRFKISPRAEKGAREFIEQNGCALVG